jgi:hypothetical protein
MYQRTPGLLPHRHKTTLQNVVAVIYRLRGVMSPEYDNCRLREHTLANLAFRLSRISGNSSRYNLRDVFQPCQRQRMLIPEAGVDLDLYETWA